MLDYQGRVVKERDQLSEKIDKLRTFNGGSIFPQLPSKERGRLTRQYMAMALYLEILNERIDAFGDYNAA